MDVNEKIVSAWLEQCENMFTKSTITYGQFHNDIDVLAIDPLKKIAWDCEIKVRTGSTMISDNNNKHNGFNKFVETMFDENRISLIQSIIPIEYKTCKMFITTKSLFGKTDKNQNKWLNRFEEKNIKVIFFDKVVNDLFSHAKVSKQSTNEIVQSYRLLNLYGDI